MAQSGPLLIAHAQYKCGLTKRNRYPALVPHIEIVCPLRFRGIVRMKHQAIVVHF